MILWRNFAIKRLEISNKLSQIKLKQTLQHKLLWSAQEGHEDSNRTVSEEANESSELILVFLESPRVAVKWINFYLVYKYFLISHAIERYVSRPLNL